LAKADTVSRVKTPPKSTQALENQSHTETGSNVTRQITEAIRGSVKVDMSEVDVYVEESDAVCATDTETAGRSAGSGTPISVNVAVTRSTARRPDEAPTDAPQTPVERYDLTTAISEAHKQTGLPTVRE